MGAPAVKIDSAPYIVQVMDNDSATVTLTAVNTSEPEFIRNNRGEAIGPNWFKIDINVDKPVSFPFLVHVKTVDGEAIGMLADGSTGGGNFIKIDTNFEMAPLETKRRFKIHIVVTAQHPPLEFRVTAQSVSARSGDELGAEVINDGRLKLSPTATDTDIRLRITNN